MNRGNRKRIAEETLRILDAGEYRLPSGAVVSIREEQTRAVEGTKLYDESALAGQPLPAANAQMNVSVTAESTGQAIFRLAAEGKRNLGCLNFASAKNPGGGFLGGSQAQEECLARSSGLYPCLLTQREYYDRNRDHRSAIYLDQLIYSPSVPFIRADDGTLYDRPVLSSVITCPAPNRGAVMNSQRERERETVPALKRRADMVLRAAAIHDVKNLVLGAWGCGVFRNDPGEVAQVFAETIERYRGHFAAIVFAIHGRESDPNREAFARVMRAAS